MSADYGSSAISSADDPELAVFSKDQRGYPGVLAVLDRWKLFRNLKTRPPTLYFPSCRVSLPAQPVDATPSSPLIWQYFPSRIDLHGGIQSEAIQGFCLFDLMSANKISLLDSCNRTLSKCCIDALRPPRFSDGMRRPVSDGMR
jgi:hypothetical protein